MLLKSVLISDAVDPACVEYLQRHDIAVTLRTKMPPKELIAEIKVKKKEKRKHNFFKINNLQL